MNNLVTIKPDSSKNHIGLGYFFKNQDLVFYKLRTISLNYG